MVAVTKMIAALTVSLVILSIESSVEAQGGLQKGFYSSTCPSAEQIVRSTVEKYFNRDSTIAAGLLRLHFHDCFVQVCLLGAHTIGQTACVFVRYRLYNFTATGNADPTINEALLGQLQAICPNDDGDFSTRVALDKGSMTKFDASFFKNLRDGNGVLESDQRLWEDDATQVIVGNYAGNIRGLLGLRFAYEFSKAMIKLSSVGVKTGTQGQIRTTCSKFN
ncbi:hypothetical protein GW17_00056492 [Ensete ventricosum]|nr:hypothetical protein GW17_00056492 [Ensete ventricosum]